MLVIIMCLWLQKMEETDDSRSKWKPRWETDGPVNKTDNYSDLSVCGQDEDVGGKNQNI